MFDKYNIDNDEDLYNVFCSVGKTIADYFIDNITNPFQMKVLVVCGKGNNGIDGLYTHYFLKKNNIDSKLFLVDKNIFKDKIHKKIINSINKDIVSDINADSYDYIFDALFGIGLSREIGGSLCKVIDKINSSKNIISIDIPSGLFADSGVQSKYTVKATITLALANYKIGYFLNSGKDAVGKVKLLDIGFKIPPNIKAGYIVDRIFLKGSLEKIENTYKTKKGKLLTYLGSENYTGASLLANLAALRSGCGIVKTITPKSLLNIYASCEEVINIVLNDDNGSILHYGSAIFSHALLSNCVLVGPGLDLNPSTVSNINSLLFDGGCKNLVVDASAFNVFEGKKNKIKDLPKGTVLTPHYGEFANILDVPMENLLDNPIKVYSKNKLIFKDKIVVLKGPSTIIFDGKGDYFFVINGNSLLASAGTGDVLSGMIASLIAQGVSPIKASLISSYTHAEISRLYSKKYKTGIIASDICKLIPEMLTKICYENN